MMDYFLLLAGLIVLIAGGEVLVKGAVSIANNFKLSPLVVGMTVVSFGTSAPELLVSIKAALSDHPEIAIGNVLGSNISNLALVLGITTIIFPMPVKINTIKIDWPVMFAATIAFYLFSLNNMLSRIEGAIFLGSLIFFIVWMIRNSRKEGVEREDDPEAVISTPVPKAILFVIVGCAMLSFGASWLLDGAVSIAESFGVSEHIIGVTIVAFGTSVPELATSCVAAFRRQTDISVGNLIGSNMFNLMAILGITSLVKPISVTDTVLGFDMFWLIGISLLVFPLMIKNQKISRISGIILTVAYFSYVLSLLFR